MLNIPNFSDKKTRQQLLAQLDNYAIAQGFSQQEIAKMADPRLMTLAYKAMMFDKFNTSGTQGK